jgi:uncharacterized protein (DUF433 family)
LRLHHLAAESVAELLGQDTGMIAQHAMAAPIANLPADDPRLSHRLCTVAEASGWLTVPRSTFHGWVHGYENHPAPGRRAAAGSPIVLSLPARRGQSAVPFVGLVEGLVLNGFRRAGVPLQRIRPALERLDQEMGLRHALASDRLTTDGVDVLYDYGAVLDPAGICELVTVRSGQRVFAPVVREYLRRIRYGADHWPEQVELPGYAIARVIVNPDVAHGRPVIEPSRIPVEDIVRRWIAGDSLAELAYDFGLGGAEVEDIIRAATRRCAA